MRFSIRSSVSFLTIQGLADASSDSVHRQYLGRITGEQANLKRSLNGRHTALIAIASGIGAVTLSPQHSESHLTYFLGTGLFVNPCSRAGFLVGLTRFSLDLVLRSLMLVRSVRVDSCSSDGNGLLAYD